MTCEAVGKNVSLFLYGELSLEDEQAFQDHIDACAACRKTFEAGRAMHELLDARDQEVPPSLLARCRRDFEEKIDAMAPARVSWLDALRRLFTGGGSFWPALARPAGAVALVALGFAGARILTPGPSGDSPIRPFAPAAATGEPVVTRVRYLQPEPSGQVRLMVEETRQRYLQGDPQDERIQQLLLTAARESSDPGVRTDSVEILKQRAASNEVRDALLHALRYDANPGVRLRALDGLKQHASEPQVRNALVEALLRDDNPGVRTQAIDLLVQHKEGALVGVLQELLQTESNSYVRLRSERALKEMNASVGTF